LHAYHSVRVQLLVTSVGLSTVDAGEWSASNDALAMAVLPALCFLGNRTGLRPMLPLAPLLALVAAAILLVEITKVHEINNDTAQRPGTLSLPTRGSLAALSLLELAIPIVPLALLPANTHNLGTAYGGLEAIFILVQVWTRPHTRPPAFCGPRDHLTFHSLCTLRAQTTIAIVLGVLRAFSGFTGALCLICSGFACAAALSIPLLSRVKDLPRCRSGQHPERVG
jgi:hypothetical protein